MQCPVCNHVVYNTHESCPKCSWTFFVNAQGIRPTGERSRMRIFIKNNFKPSSSGHAVIDYTTGLMWMRSASQYMSHNEARDYITTINSNRFIGFNNWRMPRIDELLTILTHKPIGRITDEIGMARYPYIDHFFDQKIPSCWAADIIRPSSVSWIEYSVAFVDYWNNEIYWSGPGANDTGSNVRAVRFI